ncbi:protein of unknown function [Rhodovastum atsumiense]|uniref:response regulator transcription factor n=1 Tax=Rhodovastum atsumiense TaxID=504468 RepID=UPI00139F2B1B|nr:response regulator transcription factor [Rhodovastum atsumiense]CAH2602397.1 protein of unknown function [Rhodovastum atsumiense]
MKGSDRQPFFHAGPSRRICALLIDPVRLRRDCLAQLLMSSAPDFEIHSVADCGEAAQERAALDIVLFYAMHRCAATVDLEADLQRVAAHFPKRPILMICERNEALTISETLQGGLRGIFPASLGTTLLIATLRVIVATARRAEPPAPR